MRGLWVRLCVDLLEKFAEFNVCVSVCMCARVRCAAASGGCYRGEAVFTTNKRPLTKYPQAL